MPPQLPSFLRRRLRLSEARRALMTGDAEEALRQVGDPCLAGAAEATPLRQRVLDVLCRQAAQAEERGRSDEGRRLLALVAAHDPERAAIWRRRLEEERRDSTRVAPRELPEASASSGIITALEGLLGEMREERLRAGGKSAASATQSADSRLREAASADLRARRERGALFRLAVDEVGEFLVATAPEVSLGHERGARADLTFLADVPDLAARLVRTSGFHTGPGWRIETEGGERASIGGELVDPGGAALTHGDEVQLATRLAFRFQRPVASSGTALLELLHGTECRGARHIILLAPGAEDPLRLSASRGRHLRVPRLRDEAALWLDGEELVLESSARLEARRGEVREAPARDGSPVALRLDCPPRERVDLVLGAAAGGRPPIELSVRPLEL